MKWNNDELIFVWCYYKKFGTKQSGEEFLKFLEIFRSIQNRDYSNAKSTFSLKLMNIDAWKKGDVFNEGGLSRSKTFEEVILKADQDKLEKRFLELTLNMNDIEVPKHVSDYVKKTNQIIEIDTSHVEDHQLLANVCYEEITLKNYLLKILSAEYRVPLFQREFVWSKKMIIGFLNALNKGYPFGNIVVWSSNDDNSLQERNEFIKEFRKENKGNVSSDYVQWILDGQQRTTSIISQIVNIDKFQKNKNIIYSFDSMEFKQYDQKVDSNFVHADLLLSEKYSVTEIADRYNTSINKAAIIENVRRRILGTKIGITKVSNADLNTAIDIFSEMNTTGKKLSLFDVIHSKWLSSDINFDLEDFIEKWYQKKFVIYKPDMLTIVKALYLTFDKNNISSSDILKYNVVSKDILKLQNDFEKTLDLAHDFLINVMKFKSELIPSSNLLKFIVYIYAKNNNRELNEKQISKLKKYVKYVCLQNYYSSSTDQKVMKNINVMDLILSGEDLPENIEKVKLAESDVKEIEYGDDSSKYLFIINILFRFAKSLKTNLDVPVTSVVKGASKINIHHIVPKAIKIEGQKISDMEYGNSLANLAPILEGDNLQISKKYPKDYYDEFKLVNENIDFALENMLISPKYISKIDSLISLDALKMFWDERAKMIAEKVNNA